MKELLLNVESKEMRLALLKQGKLHDLTIERKKSRQLTGNIYRGKVTNILQNIQSAFIDIDEGENGFIHISDIVENTQKFQEMYDLDFEVERKEERKKKKQETTDIGTYLNPDQPVLVQVVKEPIGSKGARLTSNLSIPGRYLVLLPNTPHRGVSRKIEDRHARERLKKVIHAFEMPQDMGLICRTASVNATTEALIEEATELTNTWKAIVDGFTSASAPTLLYEESGLVKRAITMAVDKKLDRMLVDDYETFQICKKLYDSYMGEHSLKLELYRDKTPMFERFNVEREIERAIKRKVWLSSGGYLFFERTEAMHTIDVNSGRSSHQSGSTDVEATLVHINMEAADEIARQLRLRNIGGLIICDFIDMRSRKNQRRVLERLKEAMKEDSAKCTILGMSEFGLIEMTRQRHRESLDQTLFTECPYCTGRGLIKTLESTSIDLERALRKLLQKKEEFGIDICCHPDLDKFLEDGDKKHLADLAEEANAQLRFSAKDTLHLNDFEFHSMINGHKIDV